MCPRGGSSTHKPYWAILRQICMGRRGGRVGGGGNMSRVGYSQKVEGSYSEGQEDLGGSR